MSIRWTDAEAEGFGYKKDSNGNWHSPHQWEMLKSKQKQERREHREVKLEQSLTGQGQLPRPAAKPERAVDRQNQGQVEGDIPSKAGHTQSNSSHYIVRVTMFYFRTMDPDNWIYKWYLDDLVHKGFLPGDSTEYIKKIIEQHVKVHSEAEQKTVIEVFEVI